MRMLCTAIPAFSKKPQRIWSLWPGQLHHQRRLTICNKKQQSIRQRPWHHKAGKSCNKDAVHPCCFESHHLGWLELRNLRKIHKLWRTQCLISLNFTLTYVFQTNVVPKLNFFLLVVNFDSACAIRTQFDHNSTRSQFGHAVVGFHSVLREEFLALHPPPLLHPLFREHGQF